MRRLELDEMMGVFERDFSHALMMGRLATEGCAGRGQADSRNDDAV
jgi:hypothetical protein